MPYMIGVIVRRVSFSENVALIFYLSFKSSKKKKERKKYHKRDRWRSFSSIVDIFGAICSFEKCCGEEMVKESSRSSIFSKKIKDCRSLLILRKRISPFLEILPDTTKRRKLFVEIKSGRERGKKWNYTGKSKPAFLSPPSNSRDIQKGSFVKPETTLRRMDTFHSVNWQGRTAPAKYSD